MRRGLPSGELWSDAARCLTPIVEEDLEDILFYIAVEGGRPETARRIGVEIVDAVNRHVQTAMPANRHPALPAGWFYLKHKRWLIAYEPTDASVVVHRVVDAVRDLPEQFKQN